MVKLLLVMVTSITGAYVTMYVYVQVYAYTTFSLSLSLYHIYITKLTV